VSINADSIKEKENKKTKQKRDRLFDLSLFPHFAISLSRRKVSLWSVGGLVSLLLGFFQEVFR